MVIHLAKHFWDVGVVIFFGKDRGQIPNDDPTSGTALTSCDESSTFWMNVNGKYRLLVCNRKQAEGRIVVVNLKIWDCALPSWSTHTGFKIIIIALWTNTETKGNALISIYE